MAGSPAPIALSLSLASDTGLPLDGLTRRNVVDVNILGLNVLGGPITLFDDRDGDGTIDPGEALATVANPLLAGSVRITLPEGTHSIRAVQTSPNLFGPPTVTISAPLTVRVDNTGPTIVSVNQLDLPDPLGLLDLTGLLRYEVTFSEPVLGLTANLFQATGTLPGIHLVTLLPVLGDPTRYIVSIGLGLDGISPDQRNGTLGLALNPSNLSGVTDLAGNALRGGDFALLAPVNIGPARETATADLNADGLGDAAFLVNNTVVVTQGTGTGSFGATQTITVAAGQNTIAIGDVTGDGLADIVTAGAGRVEILRQNPDGSFALTDRATAGAERAVLADVDGDGDLDIVTGNTGANTATILTNNGAGTFATGAAINLGVRPDSLVAGDFNGDGRIDIAALADGGTSLSVLTQAATGGTFVRSTLSVAAGSGALAAGDFNGDGRAEIVSGGTNGTLEIRGTTAGGAATALTIQAGSVPTDIRIGDVDGDGRQDILYAGVDGNVRVARGDGAGGFAAPIVLETQQGLTALALLDVNGDGRQDLALASGTTGTVQVGTGIPVGGILGSLYDIVAPAPVRTVTALTVAGDNVVNIAEAAGGTVTVAGTLSGPLAANETLAVRVGGVTTLLPGATIVTANGQTTFTAAIAAPAASGEIGLLVQRADGATSPPLTQAVSVDLVAPALASVTSAEGPVTKDAAVDFTVTFSEPVTGLTAANFVLTGTAAPGLVPVVTALPGGRAYTVTVAAPTAEGTLGLTFVATGLNDAAGNPVPGGALPVAVGPVLTLDRTAPVLALDPIGGDGVLSGAEITAGVTLSGTAAGLPDGASVTVSLTDAAGTPVLTQTATVTGGAFALPLAAGGLLDGAYIVSVSAADAAGNVAAPAVANLVVDTQIDGGTPLAISLGNGGAVGIAGAAAVPLTVSGLDAETTAVVSFTDGTATVAATVGANGTVPVDLSGLSGSVTSSVSITDTAGNAATVAGPSITVDTLAPAGTALLSPTQAPGTLTFDVTFGEAVLSLDAGDFRVVADGSALGTVTAVVPNGNGGYTVTIGNLSGEGTLSLALSASADIVDAAGNPATFTSPAPVAIDRVAPPAPAITGLLSDLGIPGGFSTADSTPTLAGTAEANAVVTVSFEAGGVPQTLTTQANGAGAWSVTAPILANGSYAFTATATDSAGNVSLATAPRIVTVDATPGIPFALTVDFGDGLVNATEAGTIPYALTGLAPGDTLTITFTDASGDTVSLPLDPAGGSLNLSGLDGQVTSTLTYTPAGGGPIPLLGPGATFDVVPPAQPVILGFAAPGQTPSPVTGDDTPLLVGTGDPGSLVTVVVAGTPLTAEVGADGTWRIPVTTPLAEGPLALTATATDLAGNVSQPTLPLVVTVDLSADAGAPVAVTLDLPTGRALNAGEAAALTGTVSGIDADATAILTFTGPNGSISVPVDNGAATFPDLSGLGASVAVSIRVTDLVGNAASIPLPNLAIDAVAPAATIVADPAAVPGATAVTFTVTFPEAVANLDVNDFQVVRTGTAAGTVTDVVPTAGGYLVTVSNLTGSGSVSLGLAAGADVSDLVGNLAVVASADAHLVNIPPVVPPGELPVILAITPDTGVAGDFVTSDAAPVVSGTAQANGIVTLTFTDPGGATGTITTQADLNGAWSVPLPAPTDGSYALSATLTDASNNVLGVSPAVTVTIDRVADAGTPVALAVEATANAVVDAAEAAAVSYTLTGLDAGSTALVRFTDGNLVREATVGTDGSFRIDLSGLDGNVTSSVTVTDPAGNVAIIAGNTIRVDTDPTAPPSVGGLAPGSDSGIAGDGVTSVTTPLLTGTAEAGADIAVVLTGPSGSQTLTTVADGNGVWSVATPTLADATYRVTATATGASGLPSAASAPFVLTVDTVADQAPLVGLQPASDDTRLSAPEAVAFSFTLSGLDPDSSGTVTFSDTINTIVVPVAANGTYTADLSALTGPITATASITDAAGNVSAPTLPLPAGLSVDTVAPTGSAVADLSGGNAVASFGFTVSFSEPVDGVGPGDFAVSGTPGVSGEVVGVTGSGGNYVVTVAGIQGSGTLTLGLAPGSDIADAAGNLATLVPATRDVTGITPVQPVILGFSDDTGVPGDFVTADRSPTLTGIGQPGSTVTIAYLTAAGPQAISAPVSAAGTWSVSLPDLADGAYAFEARLVDAGGAPVGVSAPLALTIDTTAPGAPVILAVTDDTGTPGDGITADATPTLSGTAEDGTTIRISYTDATGPRTLDTVATGGAWSLAIPTLADGTYAFTATAIDAAGNAGAPSQPFQVVVDTTADAAPSATLTLGASPDGVLNAAEAASAGFTVDGLDPGTTGTATFSAGGASVSVTVTGNGTYTADLSGLNGPVTTSLVLTDAAGNGATLGGTGPVIDALAPAGTATPDGSAASATTFTYLVSFPEAVANVSAEDFALIASPGAAGRVSGVEATADGYRVTVSDVSGTGTLTLGLAPGSDIADLAGNRATLSSPPRDVAVGGTPQPVPPVITAFGDDTGVPGDGITADATPTLSGTGSPNGTVTVSYDAAGTPSTVVAPVDALGNWSVAIPALADGRYSFTASGTDAAGQPTGTSGPFGLTIDTVADAAPAVSLVVNEPPSGVLTPAQAAATGFVVSGLDAGSAVAVTFRDGTHSVRVEAQTDGAYQADLSGLTGDVSASFVVTDAAGNSATGAGNGFVISGSVVPQPPLTTPTVTGLQNDTGAPGDGITNDAQPVVAGTATPGTTVVVTYTDATGPRTVTAPVDATGAWTAPLPTLPDGTYDVTASGRDATGNTTPAGQPFRIVIDTVADAGAPVSLSVEPTRDGVVNATEAVDTVYAVSGLDAGATAAVTFSDGTRSVTAEVSGNGRYAVDLTALNGTVTSTILATDAAGNAASANGNPVTLDTRPPAAPVVTGFTDDTGIPGNGATADTTPTLLGTAEAGSTVAVAYDTPQGPRTATTVAGADGHWSLDLPTLAQGTYAFVASASDAAGNRSDASAPFALAIDPTDTGGPGGDGNLAPVAVDDRAATVTHAAAISGNVLTNDSDPNAGDGLQVTAIRFANGLTVAVPASGTAAVVSDHATLHIAADGSYTYQAIGSNNLNVGTRVDETFTYTVSDGRGLTDTGSLSVSLDGTRPAAEARFDFAFVDARVEVVGEALVLRAPDGTLHDVSGIGTLHFTDGSIQENDGHALVDDVWYLSHNLDVWLAHVDADTHYETYGWREGRDPNAYFQTREYLAENADVAAAGINPLEHYAQYGEHEGRSPSHDFAPESYLSVNSDVKAAGVNALDHYLQYGLAEGRSVLEGEGKPGQFGSFDAGFYLDLNDDVAAAAAQVGPNGIVASEYAFRHYLEYGAREGRAPNALFDPVAYLAANPDVAASGVNPLLHYQEFGWHEGRNPGPGFDTNLYLARNPDVAAAGIDPLQHFIEYGLQEGRLPT